MNTVIQKRSGWNPSVIHFCWGKWIWEHNDFEKAAKNLGEGNQTTATKKSKSEIEVSQWLPGNYILLYWEPMSPVSKVWFAEKLKPFWFWASLQTGWSEEPSCCKTVPSTHPGMIFVPTSFRRRFQGKWTETWAVNTMALGASALTGTSVKILKTQGGWKAKPLVVMLSGD